VSWPDTITIEPSVEPQILGLDAVLAVQELVERLEAQFMPRTPKDEDWFGWIPLRLDVFLSGLLAVRDQLGFGRHRLLEVGSGIGSKLVLAHALGFEPVGIERYEPYVTVCRRLYPHVTVRVADAERFAGYGAYDVVYSNRVASSLDRQAAINQRIAARLAPGACLFAANCHPLEGLERVAEHVWRAPQ
jgi:2-polyprenyl-3-methyl-5-hydroxy-6-metoxy-1,4-benzoquinol methylase